MLTTIDTTAAQADVLKIADPLRRDPDEVELLISSTLPGSNGERPWAL
jgi:hypothetical protein